LRFILYVDSVTEHYTIWHYSVSTSPCNDACLVEKVTLTIYFSECSKKKKSKKKPEAKPHDSNLVISLPGFLSMKMVSWIYNGQLISMNAL